MLNSEILSISHSPLNEGQTEGNIHIVQINDIAVGIHEFEMKGPQYTITYIDVVRPDDFIIIDDRTEGSIDWNFLYDGIRPR